MNCVLDLQNVEKRYGDIAAVRNISLEIREGEFLTFLGPSGSGKTTTLMMIAGLQSPTSGTIRLRDRPIQTMPPYRRNIGMVFQHYALFPHMTAAQNIAFPLEMRNLDRATVTSKVERALELVGLRDLGGRFPLEMSGGQQQRIALARATVYEPSILLMDEPLGALDKKLREQMQMEIMSLHRKLGISILYVTHDQEEALVMSDRIAIFNKGEIEQIGSPFDLYEHPKTAFVASFVGETNLLRGMVRLKSGEGMLVETPIGMFESDSPFFSPGDDIFVAIRPERIGITRAKPMTGRSIPALIDEVIYLGQSLKFLASDQNGVRLSVVEHAPAGDLAGLRAGDQVHLSWLDKDLRFLR